MRFWPGVSPTRWGRHWWRVAVAVLAVVSALVACTPNNPATRAAIQKCWNTSPAVWLTFDDSGDPHYVNAILDVLNANNVKARFFPTGTWASANPWLIARIVLSGHLLGNHTANHLDLLQLSDAAVRAQIRGGTAPTTNDVHLLRPPYGSGAFNQRINDLAWSEGYLVCAWTVDTSDWAGPSAATIISRVRYGDASTPPVGPGGVILMHLHGHNTLAALPGVIRAVYARGLQPAHLR